MHSNLLTVYSVLFFFWINSLFDFYHRRKDIFMETAEGISCEAQWLWIKTQEWKDVRGSALSCFSLSPPSSPLWLSGQNTPFLTVTIFGLIYSISSSRAESWVEKYWNVSLFKLPMWKHTKWCLSDKRINRILFWPRGSIKGGQTWSLKVSSPPSWLTQPFLCW